MLTDDFRDIRGAQALRMHLHEELRSGRAKWIQLLGLGLDDRAKHKALCRSLTSFGFGEELGLSRPDAVVLDWSVVDGCSAEGLAFFAIIATKLAASGTRVVVCGPEAADLKEAIDSVLPAAQRENLAWIECPTVRRSVGGECAELSEALFEHTLLGR